MATTIYGTYQTDGTANPISLGVQIGYAQLAATSVTIDGVPKVESGADSNGIYRENFNISLGANSDMQGKVLEITAKVNILKSPVNSSLTINLSGTAPQGYNMDNPSTGVSVGDVIEYYASITFL
jgi:hypothetical protein